MGRFGLAKDWNSRISLGGGGVLVGVAVMVRAIVVDAVSVVVAISVVVRVAIDVIVIAIGVSVRRVINGIGNGSILVVVDGNPVQTKPDVVIVSDISEE